MGLPGRKGRARTMVTAFDEVVSVLSTAARRGELGDGNLAERMAAILTEAGVDCSAEVWHDDNWPPTMLDVLTEDNVAVIVYAKRPNKYKVAAAIRKYFKCVSGGVVLVVPGGYSAPMPLKGFEGPCAVMGI